ncbi:MAG: hypothetical protein JEY99_18855 [Spirochaetales bacterium]|nr:hypothetical protein [Spirochaetales bacterium]
MISRKSKLMIGLVSLVLLNLNILSASPQLTDTMKLVESGGFSLNDRITLYVDSRDMSVNEAAKLFFDGQFKNSGHKFPNYGFTKKAVWVGFSLKNEGVFNDWLIEVAFSLLDEIELYRLDAGGVPVLEGRSGRNVAYNDREVKHRHFFFPIDLEWGKETSFLMKFVSDDAMIIPLKITTHERIGKRARTEYFLFGSFYGIAVAMFLYNLFLFLVTRDKSYFYYILYLVSFVLFQLGMNGISSEFFWKNSVWWAIRSDPFLLFASLGFGIVFGLNFLDLKNASRFFYIALKTVGILSAVMAILSLFVDVQFSVVVGQVLPLLAVFLVIPAGIIAYMKGNRYARFYFIAWSFLLLGVTLSTLRALGVLPHHFITEHGIQFGGALEMILLSLALADRIYFLKREKQKAEHDKRSLIQISESRAAIMADIVAELKEPLNEVQELTEQILYTDEPEDIKENAHQILCESENLIELITGLYDYTRMETGRLELEPVVFSLKDTIESCLFGMRLLIEDKKVDFNIDYSDDLPPLVEGDAYRFKQIILNLVQNSYKKTETGSILINIGLLKKHSGASSGIFTFQIRDTGRGLSIAEISRIINPEEPREDSAFRMGEDKMGLTVSRHLTELMGGKFSIESRLGVGTEYSLVLPFRIPVQRRTLSFPGTRSKFKGRLLAAVSRKVDVLIISRQLEDLGFDVDTACSGEEAEHMSFANTYDLIFIESSFIEEVPELPNRLRTELGANRDTPIAAVVNSGDTQMKERCRGWEPEDILEKPLRKAEIKSLIGRFFPDTSS